LPLLNVFEDDAGFYTAHTYHVDIHFEGAFTQLYELGSAIKTALAAGKRVVVEHFELIFPYLEMNAHLLLGIGEEVLITRPSVFGPEPTDIAKIVGKSLTYRFMAHSAEDLCSLYLRDHGIENFGHDDVRHGFILTFCKKPTIDLQELEAFVLEMIRRDLSINFYDDKHIKIGDEIIPCSGPRMHVKSTRKIGAFEVAKRLVHDPAKNRWLLIGVIGEKVQGKISDLNKIVAM